MFVLFKFPMPNFSYHYMFDTLNHFTIHHFTIASLKYLTGFLLNPWFLSRNPCFLCQYPVLPGVLLAVPHVVHGGVSPLWIGGVCVRVRGFTQACSLTCYPNPQFRIPFRLPFLQWPEELSSAYHPWVGPHNGNSYTSVYPPLYLQKGIFTFFWHELTQLR